MSAGGGFVRGPTTITVGGDVECKECGKGGLHWEEEFEGHYRLYTAKDMLHKCDEKRLHKAVADDFEVLP